MLNQSSVNMPKDPRSKYMGNIFVDFNCINAAHFDKFSRDMPLWKWLEYPQVHTANLVTNSGDIAYWAESTSTMQNPVLVCLRFIPFLMYYKRNINAHTRNNDKTLGLIGLLYVMMTSWNGNISALLALCKGNLPVTGEFLSQRPAARSFEICAWTIETLVNWDAIGLSMTPL